MSSLSKKFLYISILLFGLFLCASPILAQEQSRIVMDYYYGSLCGECTAVNNSLIKPYFVNNQDYDFLTIIYKDIDTNDTAWDEWRNLTPIVGIPAVVIKNGSYETNAIDLANYQFDPEAGYQKLSQIINDVRLGNHSEKNESNGTYVPTIVGELNITGWSLPILTIVLSGLDSFNPCAFFILIFLLNLLIYARSRKRMLLIGMIFIFFSGFLYMIFMFILSEVLRTIKTPENILIITLIVGAIVLPMGLLNIKDFFFFKKGASLSIPDDKKPKIYKQMRGLVKNPSLKKTILGTILLAATVNFYELLCTLALPLIYVNELTQYYAEGTLQYYSYILFYNIIYVIPLIIIVLLFVITLGKRKLTEWHGQLMKLVSGIMLSGFGIIFLIDYKILENPITPILLLLISLGVSFVIAKIWKNKKGIPDEE